MSDDVNKYLSMTWLAINSNDSDEYLYDIFLISWSHRNRENVRDKKKNVSSQNVRIRFCSHHSLQLTFITCHQRASIISVKWKVSFSLIFNVLFLVTSTNFKTIYHAVRRLLFFKIEMWTLLSVSHKSNFPQVWIFHSKLLELCVKVFENLFTISYWDKAKTCHTSRILLPHHHLFSTTLPCSSLSETHTNKHKCRHTPWRIKNMFSWNVHLLAKHIHLLNHTTKEAQSIV